MTLHDGVEPMTLMLRIELAREPGRAQHLVLEQRAHAPILVLQESVVEADVMRCQHRSIKKTVEPVGNVPEGRSILYHPIADTSQMRDERRNGYAWIDQRFPALAFHSFLETDERNLDNAVMKGRATRGFQVQDDVGKRKQGCGRSEDRFLNSRQLTELISMSKESIKWVHERFSQYWKISHPRWGL